MKKTLFLLPVLPILLFLSACEENPLTLLPPDGQVKQEYWKHKEDVKATLMGAYRQLAQLDGDLFYYGELRADMLKDDDALSGDRRNMMFSTLYPDNSHARWGDFYKVINYCNSILKYSKQVKKSDRTFTDFKYQAYRSEAIFLRSLTYFYLVRIYRDVPFILFPYDTDDQNFFPKKTQGDVVLDSLEAQLNRIIPTIPESYETNDQTRGRATRGAVYALLTDIALWKFEYQDCIEYANYFENNDLYELVPGGSYFTIFSEGNTLEGIFELQFDPQNGLGNSLFGITIPSRDDFLASEYAMDILAPEFTKEIVRGNAALREEDQEIWKYVGSSADGISLRSGSNAQACNWIVYRLAGVMLMKAEALSQVGRYGEALNIVNEIRTRAFMERVGAQQTANAFEDLIMEERAKEFAYEGKRWFDLLRMGRRDNFERKDKLIQLIIENVPATQKRVLASKLTDPYGWYMPIHEDEIEENPNLVQNPYYQIYE